MLESVPFEAFDPNPALPMGQTLLRPPAGTVPRGWPVLAFGPGPDEAERAGRELRNPLGPAPAELARGKERFLTFCAPCHGESGLSDGLVAAPGRFPPPPSLVADHAKGLPDGDIYHVITHGQGIMPPYGAQVVPMDRFRIVLWLRALQAGSP
jgi:mono/diheme cytochrome c family protein